jgi:DNA-binding IclR family transcriptional regulator
MSRDAEASPVVAIAHAGPMRLERRAGLAASADGYDRSMPASVRKAALVLDLFSVERPDWGPTDVADELGIAKSTAHALLAELTSVGLTERLPCGRYRLGWRTVDLARTMLATSGYRDVVAPTVRRLARHFGETVHVAAWDRGRVLYVASERPSRGVAAPAVPVAAELTPPGTVLLADRAGDTGGGLDPDEAERVRRRGYAVGTQRALDGVDCAAAPLRTSDGPATAALALCAPRDRFRARRDEYARAVGGAGERIARSVRR